MSHTFGTGFLWGFAFAVVDTRPWTAGALFLIGVLLMIAHPKQDQNHE